MEECEADRPVRRAPDTVGGFLMDRWQRGIRQEVADSAMSNYATIVATYVVPRVGDVRLSRLSTRQVEHLYADLLAGGAREGGPLSPTTVGQVHRTLRRAFNDAIRWGLLNASPVTPAKVPTRRSNDDRVDSGAVCDVPCVGTWRAPVRIVARCLTYRHAPWRVGRAAMARRRSGQRQGLDRGSAHDRWVSCGDSGAEGRVAACGASRRRRRSGASIALGSPGSGACGAGSLQQALTMRSLPTSSAGRITRSGFAQCSVVRVNGRVSWRSVCMICATPWPRSS